MNKLIKFDSERGQFEIEVFVECRDPAGADPTYFIEHIIDVATDEMIELRSFEPAEQALIKASCEDVARDNACFAYQEYCEGESDRWNDREVDRDQEGL